MYGGLSSGESKLEVYLEFIDEWVVSLLKS